MVYIYGFQHIVQCHRETCLFSVGSQLRAFGTYYKETGPFTHKNLQYTDTVQRQRHMWESAQAVQAPVMAVCLGNCPIIST